MIELYTANTPNGWKVSIMLEELGLPYEVHRLNLDAGDQTAPEYLALNPNGRIPAIVDREAGNLAVFESGAILAYLAERTGRFLPADPAGRAEVWQWLMFQMAGVGPMQGQAHHFLRYSEERIDYAIERYRDETLRLYGVLDRHLTDREFLAAEYSIADIATWPWIKVHPHSGLSLDDFPHLERWLDHVAERPAVLRGAMVPPLVG